MTILSFNDKILRYDDDILSYENIDVPVIIGKIFEPTYDPNDYQVSGGMVKNFSGHSFTLQGVTPGFADSLQWNNNYTSTEHFRFFTEFQVLNIDADSNGIIFTTYSSPNPSFAIQFALITKAGADLGKIIIFENFTGSFVSSAAPLNLSVNDLCTAYIDRNANTYTFTVLNVTPGATGVTSITDTQVLSFDCPLPPVLLNATSAFRWTASNSGTQIKVTDWGLSTQDFSGADMITFGDSKESRYCIGGTSIGTGTIDRWRLAFPDKIIYNLSGPNETSNEWRLRVDEWAKYKPKITIFGTPTNDQRFGGVDTQTNMIFLINFAASWNGICFIQMPLLENTALGGNTVDLTPLIPLLENAFQPQYRIPVPSGFNPLTDNAADGAHWPASTNLLVQQNQQLYVTI